MINKLTNKYDICRGGLHKAFTTIELLVVVAIISILAALSLVSIHAVKNFSSESANKALLDSISMGLESYKTDLGKFPPSFGSVQVGSSSHEDWFGSQMLAQAMLGRASEGDGTGNIDIDPIFSDRHEGPGFKAKKRGKVYGPYIDAKVNTELRPTDSGQDRLVILDKDGNPVLYYLAQNGPSGTPRYNHDHNENGPEVDSPKPPAEAIDYYAMRGSTVDIEDRSDLPEYLLCSQGKDGVWWPKGDEESGKVDDATNLREADSE